MSDPIITINCHRQGVLTPYGMVSIEHDGPCTQENCHDPYEELLKQATVSDAEIFGEDPD